MELLSRSVRRLEVTETPDRRFGAAGSGTGRARARAQISPFWVLAYHAIEAINQRSTGPRPSDRGRPAAMLGRE